MCALVTGVQTCALPIYRQPWCDLRHLPPRGGSRIDVDAVVAKVRRQAGEASSEALARQECARGDDAYHRRTQHRNRSGRGTSAGQFRPRLFTRTTTSATETVPFAGRLKDRKRIV